MKNKKIKKKIKKPKMQDRKLYSDAYDQNAHLRSIMREEF